MYLIKRALEKPVDSSQWDTLSLNYQTNRIPTATVIMFDEQTNTSEDVLMAEIQNNFEYDNLDHLTNSFHTSVIIILYLTIFIFIL